MYTKVFIHIDFNSYFASCHQQDDRSLRGVPIGVCEHLGGIIISPSVEAKKWGIKTAMPVWEARKLYPNIVLQKVQAEKYRHYHRKFIALLSEFTDRVSVYSIDEAFLDVTRQVYIQKRDPVTQTFIVVDPFEEATEIAKEIKRRISVEVGDWLKVSIGIGPSKLVAKIASDLQKPDGLVVVPPHRVDALYEKLSLTDIPGIGHRMEKRFRALGIMTLKQLRDYPEDQLVRHFGVMGKFFSSMGRLESGTVDIESVVDIKSMGHVYTLPKAHRALKNFDSVLYQLAEMVAVRMRKKHLCGTVISAHAHVDAECYGKTTRLRYAINDGKDIFYEAKKMLGGAVLGREVELVGVTVAGLQIDLRDAAPMLFPEMQRRTHVLHAMDKVNKKYGPDTLARTTPFLSRDVFSDSVGFGRVKEI